MIRKRVVRVIVAVMVLTVGIGALQFSTAVKKSGEEESLQREHKIVGLGPEKKPDLKPGNSMPLGETVKIEKIAEKQVVEADIELSGQVLDFVKNSDKKNADRNTKNFKKFLKEFRISEKRQGDIINLIKKGHGTPDVLTAYNFLSESYGLMSEMQMLLKEKDSGKQWVDIFKEYNTTHKEFQPTNFEPGFLEELMKDPDITGDDVMNADRISQKKLKTFDELIKMKKQGMTWKEIKTGLDLANTDESLPRIAVEGSQVKKYTDDTGLSEAQVIDAIIMAGRTGDEEEFVIQKVKSGKKKEDILSEAYSRKYSK